MPVEKQFTTSITEMFNIQHPILLAGMNVAAGPKLAAAVTNAGSPFQLLVHAVWCIPAHHESNGLAKLVYFVTFLRQADSVSLGV